MATITLDSGRRSLTLRRADNTEHQWEFDLVTVKLAMEQAENRHSVRDKDGNLGKFPAAFFKDLAGVLESQGCEGCNADLAWKVWHILNEMWDRMSDELYVQIEAVAREG